MLNIAQGYTDTLVEAAHSQRKMLLFIFAMNDKNIRGEYLLCIGDIVPGC